MRLVKTWPSDPLGPLNVQVEVMDCSECQSDEIQAGVHDGSNYDFNVAIREHAWGN